MNKKLLLLSIIIYTCYTAHAGGIVTNTNQSAHFLRNPARDASTEIDAAYSNPAGLSFLPNNGFYMSVSDQIASQKRTIVSTFAPLAGFGGNPEKEFIGTSLAPFIPNIQAAYKMDDWTFSASVGIVGAGGTAEFKDGSTTFEALVAIVPSVLTQFGMQGIEGYSLESNFKGTSGTWGAQFGASYKFLNNFSGYAGIRYSYVMNLYEGYVRNVKVGVNGQMVNAQELIASDQFLSLALNPLVADKALDCSQFGGGIAPILGLDFNYNGLNIGIKYEFLTSIEVENETKNGNNFGSPSYNDGVKSHFDFPAMFGIGVDYNITPQWCVGIGFHYFFDKNAKFPDDRQELIDKGTREYVVGVEYIVNPEFTLSIGGGVYSPSVSSAYQSDMNYENTSFSFGLGGAWNINDKMRLNLAYFYSFYDKYDKVSEDYGNIHQLSGGLFGAIPGRDNLTKSNFLFGIGLEYIF
ncbi:MAG: aromatic hydrocarbon degradation protein [Ignavibacteria bacterium]|jgi:long-chain fatty acid transport protein|nr:aromatic hydrocarbon degradation protein [Ignavibacteria bacterium]